MFGDWLGAKLREVLVSEVLLWFARTSFSGANRTFFRQDVRALAG